MGGAHQQKLKQAFAYLEARLTNNCEAAYHCAELYNILALVRMFNPLFAAAHLAADAVDGLSDIPSLVVLISKLKREVPAYLVAARGVQGSSDYDASDMRYFTDNVLTFWRTNSSKFPTWAQAAKIVFSWVPSSAASERVFALVKNLFGVDQLSNLADCIQVFLMLNYNWRVVG